MSIFDDAKSKADSIVSEATDMANLVSDNPADLSGLTTATAAVLADANALQARVALCAPKPLPTGLWTRDNPVATRAYDPAFDGFVGRINWSDLEPSPGKFSSKPIDAIRAAAAKHGKLYAGRFYSGSQAPTWAKNLGGPITVHNPTDNVTGTVGAWWETPYQQAHEGALAYLASQIEADDSFLMISLSLGGMIYPEPLLRYIGDKVSHANLTKAGLTTAKDHAAMKWAVDTCALHFKRTRTFVTLHPGQDFTQGKIDLPWSDAMTEYTRQSLGQRGIFYSTSLDAPADKAAPYHHLYDKMVAVGGPRAIQTEQNNRVANWHDMMAYGIQLGMCMVECSPGGWEHMMSVAQAETYSDKLAANVADY